MAIERKHLKQSSFRKLLASFKKEMALLSLDDPLPRLFRSVEKHGRKSLYVYSAKLKNLKK